MQPAAHINKHNFSLTSFLYYIVTLFRFGWASKTEPIEMMVTDSTD